MSKQKLEGMKFEGFFIVPVKIYDPMLCAFASLRDGAHLLKDHKTEFKLKICVYDSNGNFNGEAIDEFGESTIVGNVNLKSDEINFNKVYTTKTNKDDYYCPLKYTGEVKLEEGKLCCNGEYSFEGESNIDKGGWEMEGYIQN